MAPATATQNSIASTQSSSSNGSCNDAGGGGGACSTTSSLSGSSIPGTTTTSANSNRKTNETTLTHLTKRFVKLLNASSERVINLNEASTRLSVAKRRIYDITNVLEGIGLLQKTSKNVTRWVDCPADSPFAAPQHANNCISSNNTTTTNINNNLLPASATNRQFHHIGQQQQPNNIANGVNISANNQTNQDVKPGLLPDAELLELLKTYQTLEEGVNDLEAAIRQQLSANGAYVTYNDIKSFFNDQIVIAVKAPRETRLEVNESLQIWMKSENGEIEVYLCPQYGNTTATTNNSSNTQPLDNSNTNNLITPQQPYTAVSSDEGRGRSTISTTDGQYYDPTTGVSTDDHYYNNDPTLSSALSGPVSEDEDPFRPLVPFEAGGDTHYNFMMEDTFSVASLFPEDNLGLYS